ncbi:MAG: phosphotransferase [Chitinispirillaceae bacterium]|nr:phosphotransferase [Chitinispirillaceae bacterium]
MVLRGRAEYNVPMSFTTDQMEPVLRDNLEFTGITHCHRIPGGYSRYTYSIGLDKNTFVFQIHTPPDDMPASPDNSALHLLYPGGADNTRAANRLLEQCAIRVPKTVFSNDSKRHLPYRCVLTDFIPIDCYNGMEQHRHNATLNEFLFDFGVSISKLKHYKRNCPGEVHDSAQEFDPVSAVYDVALSLLSDAPGHTFVHENREMIRSTLTSLRKKLTPKDNFHIIHSDIKPDNFRFDADGNIYWVDNESLQYFDMEFELAQCMIPEFSVLNTAEFLQGYFYNWNVSIDEDRLRYYKIYWCIA